MGGCCSGVLVRSIDRSALEAGTCNGWQLLVGEGPESTLEGTALGSLGVDSVMFCKNVNLSVKILRPLRYLTSLLSAIPLSLRLLGEVKACLFVY